MPNPDGDIESIIRRIIREEIESAGAASQSEPVGIKRKLLYSVADVAALTGMSTQYVRNDIRSGHLAAAQPSGSKYLIEQENAAGYASWLATGRR